MEIPDEQIEVLRSEVKWLRKAISKMPNMPIGDFFACGCQGPLPECRCAREQRLIQEFLKLTEPTQKPPASPEGASGHPDHSHGLHTSQ